MLMRMKSLRIVLIPVILGILFATKPEITLRIPKIGFAIYSSITGTSPPVSETGHIYLFTVTNQNKKMFF
jgi:hypothetical protein